MKEKNEYILGTERADLHRLGLQHQVWSGEARRGWEIAEFTEGQTILDLGCGPGYCTKELAYIVGQQGKVIGVDQSKHFIDYLQKGIELDGLENVDLQCASFDDMELEEESLDGIYHRWALAWSDNPQYIISRLYEALKPGGVIVSHEYYDWSIFQTEPQLPALNHAVKTAYSSFENSDGEINIGKHLPRMFQEVGLEVISQRTISKVGYNYDLVWQWPKSFLEIYIPKLMESEALDPKQVEDALSELIELEDLPGASICCPLMCEVVAVKA